MHPQCFSMAWLTAYTHQWHQNNILARLNLERAIIPTRFSRCRCKHPEIEAKKLTFLTLNHNLFLNVVSWIKDIEDKQI